MKSFYPSVFIILLLLFTQVTLAQVPVFNSYPSASAVVFIDFDGHTVNGTSWNYDGPIVCGPSNLSNAQMVEIYNRVAEDYRPFNINVTTDSTKYWAAPVNQRMRAVLTITSDWYGNGAGGVSYIGSFTWGDNSPCFIFTALLRYDTKSIAEAVAHEVGHTLGLRHQSSYDANCVKTSDYNYGNGAGETGWAPIMGVGYYKNYTLWHNGSNPYGCTNFQDDLGIITSRANGFGYRPRDYDSSFTNAYTLSFANNQFTASGVISTDKDKDMFAFAIPQNGRFMLSATPYSVGAGDAGANLDIQVQLYNSNKQLIGTYNPPDLLSATVDTTLNAGNYYYSISGSSNQYASEYASLGSYTLQGMYSSVATPLPLRVLKLQGVVNNNIHKLSWLIEADEKVVQQVLESSADGKNFTTVAQVNNDIRTYSYVPSASGVLQYRLNVLFDNGRQYYSNTIVLRDNDMARPHLVTNIVHNNTINISSPSVYAYAISDFAGKIVAQGRLVHGVSSIATHYLSNGVYAIQYNNGSEQYVEKFVKQ